MPPVAPSISMSTPRWAPTPKRSSITPGGRPSTSFTPSVWCAAATRGSSPASLARNEFTPSQAITARARSSPPGRSVRTPTTPPRSSRSRPVATVEVTRSAPAAVAWAASQLSKSDR
jgi:hypothetical protein